MFLLQSFHSNGKGVCRADIPQVLSLPPKVPVSECWAGRVGEERVHFLGGSVDPMHHLRLKQLHHLFVQPRRGLVIISLSLVKTELSVLFMYYRKREAHPSFLWTT